MELTIGEKENLPLFLWIKQGDFMRETSALYKSILSSPHRKEAKIEVYDSTGETLVATFGENRLISLSTERSLFSKDTFCIGSCACGEIDVEFFPLDDNDEQVTIPRMAMIKPFYRLASVEDETVVSEWIQKGVFFTDTRSINKVNGAIKIHGFDAMLKAENNYPSDDANNYPLANDAALVDIIANAMGVQVDSRTYDIITGDHQIGLPLGYSQREVLSGIAAMHFANFCISDEGKLLAVGIVTGETVTAFGDEDGNVILIGGVGIVV